MILPAFITHHWGRFFWCIMGRRHWESHFSLNIKKRKQNNKTVQCPQSLTLLKFYQIRPSSIQSGDNVNVFKPGKVSVTLAKEFLAKMLFVFGENNLYYSTVLPLDLHPDYVYTEEEKVLHELSLSLIIFCEKHKHHTWRVLRSVC